MKLPKINFAYSYFLLLLLLVACKKNEVDTEAPLITIANPEDGAIIEGGMFQLVAEVSDDVDLKTIEIRVVNSASAATEFEKSEQQLGQQINITETIVLSVPDGGNFELTITATDQSDNSASQAHTFKASPTNRGTLDLNFRLQYGEETLVTFEDVSYPEPQFSMMVSLVSFFISNVTVLNGSDEQEILEIERLKINENHDDQVSAEQGATISIPMVMPGDYSGLQFGIGVPVGLNAQSPVDFPQNHPLFFSGEYWDSWDSYIFFKIEGKADIDGDGVKETNIALHAGSNDAFREKEVASNFSIQAQEATTLEFVIEVKDIFDNNGTIYDLITTPQIHSLSQIDQAVELADNLVEAIQ